MSTLTDIGNRVQRNLDDLNANFFKRATDINPSIQDGYNLVAALTETIEKSATITLQSGLVYYDFATLIPDYLRIFGIYNNNTNRWMHPITPLALYRVRDDWELANDQPYWFWPINYRKVALFPVLATATGTITVLYKAKADTLLDDSTPQVPIERDGALEFYSSGDLLEQAEEFTKALDYMGMLDMEIEQIKKVLRERSQPNHLYFTHDI